MIIKKKSKNLVLLFLLQGNPSYTRPPPLKPGGYELYDSCVDNASNPTMYIVFERDQCYPKYLIEYEMWESAPNVSARSSGSALKGRQTYLHNSDNYLPPKDTNCNSQYPNIASASKHTNMILITIPHFKKQAVALNTLIQDLHQVEGEHTHVALKIIHDLKNQSITFNILIQDLHQVQGKDTQRFLIFILHINMNTIAPNAMICHRKVSKQQVLYN